MLSDVDPQEPIPPITYYVLKIGKLLLPYYPPGDPTLAGAVRAVAGRHHAVLLANHGPVIAGNNLEAAKPHLLLRGQKLKLLSAEQVNGLRRKYPS